MKREGRQHGMVQTYPFFNSRSSKLLASPASAAGHFTRVSQKPTNHSKFTGRCGRPRCACCHVHPANKSKDKSKGTERVKSSDVVTNYRLLTWGVVDQSQRHGLKLTGFSATGILDQLANDCGYDDDGEDYGDENDDGSPYYDDDGDGDGDADDGVYEYGYSVDSASTSAIASTGVVIEELDNFDGGDDDDTMSFCDVGFMWEQVEVEGGADGWCLVEEM